MIHAGIDRGFDRGAAAWALDLHGCVSTGASEADAIDRLPDRVDAFVAWLAASGERAEPPGADVQVVERCDSYLLEDGYEVNATFEADRRRVSEREAEVALRWLELAHQRLTRAIAAAGTGPLSGEGRTRDEMLGHIARAERWLATRVEPDQAAIAFPREDLPIERQLDANQAFVRDHVLRAAGGDGIQSRVDSKGEGWTARKILRRLVYHVLDHAEELERRGQGRRRRP
jgi:hypothetical protein